MKRPASAPTIAVDPTSAVPPFEQIRVSIETLIVGGTLTSGSPLPSVRQLAADLRVAPGTVQRAYNELQDAGLVESVARRGVIVSDSPARADINQVVARAARAYVDAGARKRATPDELRRALEQALAEQAAAR